MIDNEAQAVFRTGVSTGMIKCMGGYNHCGLRNKIINSNGLTNQYPWYIDIED